MLNVGQGQCRWYRCEHFKGIHHARSERSRFLGHTPRKGRCYSLLKCYAVKLHAALSFVHIWWIILFTGTVRPTCTNCIALFQMLEWIYIKMHLQLNCSCRLWRTERMKKSVFCHQKSKRSNSCHHTTVGLYIFQAECCPLTSRNL